MNVNEIETSNIDIQIVVPSACFRIGAHFGNTEINYTFINTNACGNDIYFEQKIKDFMVIYFSVHVYFRVCYIPFMFAQISPVRFWK